MSDLVLGFGCERGIRAESVRQGIRDFLDRTQRPLEDVGLMATIDVKKDEEGLLTAAEELGLELRFYGSDRLETVSPPNPNPVVKQAVGTEGVAESAALLASDRGGLLREKTVLRPREMAMTLALAKRNERAEKGRNHHESN